MEQNKKVLSALTRFKLEQYLSQVPSKDQAIGASRGGKTNNSMSSSGFHF